jgi:hypothetical protein
MIRIVGFMRLSLDLTELGARQWETYLTWFYVLGLAGEQHEQLDIYSNVL